MSTESPSLTHSSLSTCVEHAEADKQPHFGASGCLQQLKLGGGCQPLTLLLLGQAPFLEYEQPAQLPAASGFSQRQAFPVLLLPPPPQLSQRLAHGLGFRGHGNSNGCGTAGSSGASQSPNCLAGRHAFSTSSSPATHPLLPQTGFRSHFTVC